MLEVDDDAQSETQAPRESRKDREASEGRTHMVDRKRREAEGKGKDGAMTPCKKCIAAYDAAREAVYDAHERDEHKDIP